MNIYQSLSVVDSEPISKYYRASAFTDAKPELAAPGTTPERLAHLNEHGFVIITDFVDNPWIPILREAAAVLPKRARPIIATARLTARRATCTARETMNRGQFGV